MARTAAGADRFSEFMRAYRQRYPDYATAVRQRKPEPAQPGATDAAAPASAARG